MPTPKDNPCTVLWNKWTSEIWKGYYYCMQEKKEIKDLHEWLKDDCFCSAGIVLFQTLKLSVGCGSGGKCIGRADFRVFKTNAYVQQISECSSLPSRQSSSPSQRQRSWMQRLLLHWNCSALHSWGSTSPSLTGETSSRNISLSDRYTQNAMLPLHKQISILVLALENIFTQTWHIWGNSAWSLWWHTRPSAWLKECTFNKWKNSEQNGTQTVFFLIGVSITA